LRAVIERKLCLIYLLLLVDTVFTWAAVYEEEKPADNGEDLEEIVFGKVLVRVVFVELSGILARFPNMIGG
jgi:hypothetical protein